MGDKVLLLLPSNNKLILTWKGPFTIIDKRSDIDFVVDLGTREGTFHINLLKKYEERESLPPANTKLVPWSTLAKVLKIATLHLLYSSRKKLMRT